MIVFNTLPNVHVHFLLRMFILFVFLSNCVCISGQGHPYPWIGGSSESLWQAFIHNMKSGFCPIQRYRLPKPTEILLLSRESQIKSTGVTWCWFSKELSLTDLDKKITVLWGMKILGMLTGGVHQATVEGFLSFIGYKISELLMPTLPSVWFLEVSGGLGAPLLLLYQGGSHVIALLIC